MFVWYAISFFSSSSHTPSHFVLSLEPGSNSAPLVPSCSRERSRLNKIKTSTRELRVTIRRKWCCAMRQQQQRQDHSRRFGGGVQRPPTPIKTLIGKVSIDISRCTKKTHERRAREVIWVKNWDLTFIDNSWGWESSAGNLEYMYIHVKTCVYGIVEHWLSDVLCCACPKKQKNEPLLMDGIMMPLKASFRHSRKKDEISVIVSQQRGWNLEREDSKHSKISWNL